MLRIWVSTRFPVSSDGLQPKSDGLQLDGTLQEGLVIGNLPATRSEGPRRLRHMLLCAPSQSMFHARTSKRLLIYFHRCFRKLPRLPFWLRCWHRGDKHRVWLRCKKRSCEEASLGTDIGTTGEIGVGSDSQQLTLEIFKCWRCFLPRGRIKEV